MSLMADAIKMTAKYGVDPNVNIKKSLPEIALGVAKMANKGSEPGALKTVNVATSVYQANDALKFMKNATPGKAIFTSGAVAIEKVLILAGMQNKYKCEIAIGSLATQTSLTIAATPTMIGFVVGVIGVLAQGIEAYGACHAEIKEFKEYLQN